MWGAKRKLLLSLLASIAAVAIVAPGANAGLSWNQSARDFGSVTAGGLKVSSGVFTLTATCDAGSVFCASPSGGVHNFGSPVISGEGFAIGTVPANTCLPGLLLTATFPSSSSCVTAVRFAPTTTGVKTGTLSLPAGPDVSLQGTGIAGPSTGGSEGTVGGKKKCKKKGKKRSAAAAKRKCKKTKKKR
jgi:hypothetical protein